MAQTQQVKTGKLKMVLLEVGAAGQTTPLNENLAMMDLTAGGIVVKDKDQATPPTLVNGEAFIVAASPTGAWAGHAKDLAFAINSAWFFLTPWKGLTVYVDDEDVDYKYSGSAWAIKTASSTVAEIFTWVNKTASFTASSSEAANYSIDATSGSITASLPAAASNTGVTWTFKRTDVSANAVTLDANGSELIDDALTLSLSPGGAVKLSSNGTKYLII